MPVLSLRNLFSFWDSCKMLVLCQQRFPVLIWVLFKMICTMLGASNGLSQPQHLSFYFQRLLIFPSIFAHAVLCLQLFKAAFLQAHNEPAGDLPQIPICQETQFQFCLGKTRLFVFPDRFIIFNCMVVPSVYNDTENTRSYTSRSEAAILLLDSLLLHLSWIF